MKNGNGGAAAAHLSLQPGVLTDDVGDNADGFTIFLLAPFGVRGC